jgi:hypothetical protein
MHRKRRASIKGKKIKYLFKLVGDVKQFPYLVSNRFLFLSNHVFGINRQMWGLGR